MTFTEEGKLGRFQIGLVYIYFLSLFSVHTALQPFSVELEFSPCIKWRNCINFWIQHPKPRNDSEFNRNECTTLCGTHGHLENGDRRSGYSGVRVSSIIIFLSFSLSDVLHIMSVTFVILPLSYVWKNKSICKGIFWRLALHCVRWGNQLSGQFYNNNALYKRVRSARVQNKQTKQLLSGILGW